MPRHGLSDAAQRERAVQAARRMVSRGERPGYRLRIVPISAGIAWSLEGLDGCEPA